MARNGECRVNSAPGATCIVSQAGGAQFELPIGMVDELIDDGFVILGDDRLYHVTPAGLTQALHGSPSGGHDIERAG